MVRVEQDGILRIENLLGTNLELSGGGIRFVGSAGSLARSLTVSGEAAVLLAKQGSFDGRGVASPGSTLYKAKPLFLGVSVAQTWRVYPYTADFHEPVILTSHG